MKIDPEELNDITFTKSEQPTPKIDVVMAPMGAPISGEPCCGGKVAPASKEKPSASLPFATGEIIHRGKSIPRVSRALAFEDRTGSLKARFGVHRMEYTIPPGLYAVGVPNEDTDVLVTANYKMTFDALRSHLKGLDAWILVLDTRGINVWCAAGKGTFGTDELLYRMSDCELGSLVSHRRIIVPQLGAPGVAGYQIKKQSGFKVIFGPVEARDIPAFLQNGRVATEQMRRKYFPLADRMALIPIELVAAAKAILTLCLIFIVLSGVVGTGTFMANLETSGLFAVRALLGALVGGSILFPVLLPFLPGRSFSVKSLPLGVLMSALILAWQGVDFRSLGPAMEAVSWSATIMALTAYMAMNFTGASTYTSLSGVQKEMRIALPTQIATASLGLLFWIGSQVVSYWG